MSDGYLLWRAHTHMPSPLTLKIPFAVMKHLINSYILHITFKTANPSATHAATKRVSQKEEKKIIQQSYNILLNLSHPVKHYRP